MKKIVIVTIAILLGLTSCDAWLDINYDPSSPAQVPNSLLLPSSELIVATRVGGNFMNLGGFFAQYWEQAPEANQYNTLAQFDIGTGIANETYSEYFLALNNLKMVIEQAKQEEEWGYYIAAKTLRCYAYQVLVDVIEDVPYSEALNPANAHPKYDKGADVYAGLLAELDEALSHADKAKNIDKTDLIFAGNVEQWIGFARALQLKMYMRLSSKTGFNQQDKIKALLTEGKFFSGNVAITAFADAAGKRNPWYETHKIGLNTTNHIAALPLLGTLTLSGTNKPLISALFASPNDEAKGIVPGYKQGGPGTDKTGLTASFSIPTSSATRPVYIFSQAELQFFIAEAEVRFNSDYPTAKAAYDKAVNEIGEIWGVAVTPCFNFASAADVTDIYKQKWVSLVMVNNMEAWIETRRTGYPKYGTLKGKQYGDASLSDFDKYTEAGTLIHPYLINDKVGENNYLNRLPYPERSTSVNPNAPKQKASWAEKVFWQN